MNNFKMFLKNYNYKWRYKLFWCLPIFVVLVSLDWITKSIAVNRWKAGFTGDIIPGLFEFNFLLNLGSAFGANSDRFVLTITLATISTIVLSFALIFINDKLWIHSLNIFYAGAVGNLIARAWAPANHQGIYGGVVDFISFNHNLFPSWVPEIIYNYSFNLADFYVNLAVGLLIVCIICLIVYEIKIFRYKKTTEVIDFYVEIQSIKETLNHKLIANIKKQKIKKKFFLYKEWIINLKIEDINFAIFNTEYKIRVLFKENELQKKNQKKIISKNDKIEKWKKQINKLTEKKEKINSKIASL